MRTLLATLLLGSRVGPLAVACPHFLLVCNHDVLYDPFPLTAAVPCDVLTASGALAQTTVFFDDFSSCTGEGAPDPSKWAVSNRQWVRFYMASPARPNLAQCV